MYQEYYGLTEKPFNLTPDPRFLYLSKQHEEAFAHLMYGIQNRSGFVMISGEIGTGKTTICRSLLKDLDDNIELALIFNPYLSPQQLLKRVNRDFGIESESMSTLDLIDELNEYLLTCAAEGKNCVLIIDEAQDLSAEILEQIRLLSNLETEKEKLLQIVLIGQPELAEKLQLHELRQLNQRITARYHLEALNMEETLQYIAFRLHVAGGQKKVRFTRKAVREVYAISQGTPRVINALCDRALLIGYTKETRKITPEIIKAAAKEVQGNEKVQIKKLDTRSILRTAGLLSSAAAMVLVILLFMSGPFSPIDTLFDSGTQTDSADLQSARPIISNQQVDATAIESSVPDEPTETAQQEVVALPTPEKSTETVAKRPIADQVDDTIKTESLSPIAKQLDDDEMPDPASANEKPEPIVVAAVPTSAPKPIQAPRASSATDPAALKYALEKLYSIWQVNADAPMPTQTNLQAIAESYMANGFSVSVLTSSLQQLRVINRPALIQINDGQATYWVALTELNEQRYTATNREGDLREGFTEELEAQYRDLALIPWKDPVPDLPSLFLANSGELIWMLQYTLDDLGLMSVEPTGFFNENTREVVMRIQQQAGLDVDGIYGAQTRMVVQGWLDALPGTPYLSPQAYSLAAREALDAGPKIAEAPKSNPVVTTAPSQKNEAENPIDIQEASPSVQTDVNTYEPILPPREGPAASSVTEPAQLIVPLVPGSEEDL